MGTRSLIVFEDKVGNEICVVYRQYDGYPDGRGKELLDFLRSTKLVNGFNAEFKEKQSNGMEDLVAQWIAYEKVENGNGPHHVGNVYVFPPGTRDMMEEYIYYVKPYDTDFLLTGYDVYKDEKFSAQDIYKF